MAKVKVDRDIKEALDGLIYKGEHYTLEEEVNRRIENIIRCHARAPWTGYKQLNRLTLLELVDILRNGYECEPDEEEKLVKSYERNLATVKFYKGKSGLHGCEREQDSYSRGYVAAFEDMLSSDIDIDKVIKLLNEKGL